MRPSRPSFNHRHAPQVRSIRYNSLTTPRPGEDRRDKPSRWQVGRSEELVEMSFLLLASAPK